VQKYKDSRPGDGAVLPPRERAHALRSNRYRQSAKLKLAEPSQGEYHKIVTPAASPIIWPTVRLQRSGIRSTTTRGGGEVTGVAKKSTTRTGLPHVCRSSRSLHASTQSDGAQSAAFELKDMILPVETSGEGESTPQPLQMR